MNRILIVDDEQDVCTVLRKVLEQDEIEADNLDDPLSALENFKPNLCDLLILDIKMPEMDGFKLYKGMKRIDSKVKVCFLTGSEMDYEEIRKGEVLDALDKDLFLQKPIRNEDLINEIKRIVNSR
jgi:DNA-binding response OmpR family regulator